MSKKHKKLSLYVWHHQFTDWTWERATVLAYTLEEARSLAVQNGMDPKFVSKNPPEIHNSPVCIRDDD